MATLTMEHMRELRGAPVVDRDGDKLGTVEHIYLDVRASEPQWIAVKTGAIGGRTVFAPLEGAMIDGNTIQLAIDKSQVEASPEVYPDAISTHQEEALRQHYGFASHAGATPEQYGMPATESQREQYAVPATESQREPLRARLERWEWEARQR